MIERRCVVTLVVVVAKNKNIKNPLKSMGGIAPGASLPVWPYKSKLLTPKPKAYHHLLSEGIILFKAINLKKLSVLTPFK